MRDMHDFVGFDKTTNITNNQDMLNFHNQMHSGDVRGYSSYRPSNMHGLNGSQTVWHHFFMVITLVLLVSFLLSGIMFFVKNLKEGKK